MKKVLILFAHPKYEQSRASKALLNKVKNLENVTITDLYEEYPAYHIDVRREKETLEKHDIIIWQHPLYWYSCPPLLKKWIDEVLEFGWAYGYHGNALKNKTILNVITTGGTRWKYSSSGSNSYAIKEFMHPFEQTAKICGMNYLPPFAAMGVHHLSQEELDFKADLYARMIIMLQKDEINIAFKDYEYLNDIPELKTNHIS